MPFQATVVRVLIASPSDIKEERNIIREAVHSWNSVNAETRQIVLLPVGWDRESSPQMGGTAQEIINRQIADPADLLIAVFGIRLGTPTSKYPSGTVEEIERHVKAKKIAMVYFAKTLICADDLDPKQYEQV